MAQQESRQDVDSKQTIRELALFAGAGGGIQGGHLLGWRTVCAVEIEPYASSVLIQRQNEGILEPFPIWDDVCTFNGMPWRGKVDVVSGGFPCQDISCAGKGAGIDGARSGLWREMHRIIGEVRPRYVFVENSPMLVNRGLTRVLGDLASLGYDAAWMVLGADDVGAPHRRKRIWILAEDSERRGFFSHSDLYGTGRWEQQPESASKEADGDVSDSYGERGTSLKNEPTDASRPLDEEAGKQSFGAGGSERKCEWWSAEPDVGRVAHGIPNRVDRLKAIGNAQVPLVAATAFRRLKQILTNN